MSLVSLIAFIGLMSSLPYATLWRRRVSYLLWDLSSYAFLLGLWLLSLTLQIRLEPSLVFAIFVVAKLAVFASFLVASDDRVIPSVSEGSVEYGGRAMQFFAPPTLRRSLASLGMTPGFTANRAGLFAGLLYLCLVPQVLRWPIDGDEPYYLLVSESLIADRDLDLRNQYAAISRSETRRPDLRPQVGDPVGREGQQYSRTEPFLSLLMIPGFLLFGLPGALATIAIFGGLLVRSTLLLLSEQRISNRAIRVCFVFLALGPPILFYATRIWPEVPAAFCLVEALRGLRNERVGRLTAALAGLALLKLRFALIAVALVVLFFLKLRPKRATVVAVLMLLALPFVLIFLTTGQWLNVHELWELIPQSWWKYPRGLFGLLLDAQAGLLFQAPFYLLGLAALIRWRELPATVKWAIGSVALYLILLFPRDEWHGGWSPPLRYLVVLIPVLAVAAATLVDRLPAAILALLGIITAAFTIHGLAFPWRLFHIASGESVLGEFLSARYGTDFSRMLPSFVRLNRAAVVASIVLILVAGLSLLVRRIPTSIGIGVLALLLAAGFTLGRLPGDVVHFEDSHVSRRGGELYPHQYTVARFAYTGGWRLRPGDEVTFAYSGGASTLHYLTLAGAELAIDTSRVRLPAAGGRFAKANISTSPTASHTIRCLSGEVILDRIEEQ